MRAPKKKKVMKLLDATTSLMECRVCGFRHYPTIQPGGKYRRGSWQCANGCQPVPASQKAPERP